MVISREYAYELLQLMGDSYARPNVRKSHMRGCLA